MGGVVLACIVASYLLAALWAPRADKEESFQPVAAHALNLQAAGKHIALMQPDERLGALVFYSQQLQQTLDSTAELQAFLRASPDNVAIVEQPVIPGLALNIVDKVSVGRHHYYFISLATPGPRT